MSILKHHDVKKGVVCGKSLTKQKTGEEYDINKIVARYQKTGVLPLSTDNEGLFIDCVNLGDFHTAQEKIARVKQSFESLPSTTRELFGNDVSVFVDAINNMKPEQVGYFESLGLIKPKPKPDATAIEGKKDGDDKK